MNDFYGGNYPASQDDIEECCIKSSTPTIEGDFDLPDLEIVPLWLEKELSSVRTCQKAQEETSAVTKVEKTQVTGQKLTKTLSLEEPNLQSQDEAKVFQQKLQEKVEFSDILAAEESVSQNNGYKGSPRQILMSHPQGCDESLSSDSQASKQQDKTSSASEGAVKARENSSENSSNFDIPQKLNKRQKKSKLRLSKKVESCPLPVMKTSSKGLEESKKQRKRTKLMSSGHSSSKDIVDLATRRDVVNKTILRVLRRYFSNQFKAQVEQVYENKAEKHTKYYDYIGEFTEKLFGKDHEDFKTLQFYLASIIDHKFVNELQVSQAGMVEADLTTYYDCLYKYSHTRMVNLLGIRYFGLIYSYFYENSKGEVLASEPSLSKNRKLYNKVIDEFRAIFEGELDINQLVM